jgi:two-component system OmpR family response regulator
MNAHTHPRVLLVEDDEDIRDLLCRLLHSYGCEPALAGTEAEIQHHLSQGSIALALVDIMLPGLDGREVVKALRAADVRFPIYFVTGMHALVTDKELELVDGVLYKPFTVQELRELLDKIIGDSLDRPSSHDAQALELSTAAATLEEAVRRRENEMHRLYRSLDAGHAGPNTARDLMAIIAALQGDITRLRRLLDGARNLIE